MNNHIRKEDQMIQSFIDRYKQNPLETQLETKHFMLVPNYDKESNSKYK